MRVSIKPSYFVSEIYRTLDDEFNFNFLMVDDIMVDDFPSIKYFTIYLL